MEEEKKEQTLEELYAPPTSTDEAPAERPKKKWSVGLVMDLVFSTVAIVGANGTRRGEPQATSAWAITPCSHEKNRISTDRTAR